MQPGAYDPEFVRGDDYTLRITFDDGADPPGALDLSGNTFAAQLRRYEDDPDAVDFTVEDTDLDTGVLVLSLTDDVTASLGRSYAWDLEMTASDLSVVTVLAGTATAKLDVTRATTS